MSELSTFFLHLLVGRVLLEERPVGLPKVTEALFSSIFRRNLCPEPSTGLGRAVSDYESNDLASPSAQRHPEPSLVRSLADIGPAFVEFEDIAFFGGVDLISYWLGFASLFLSQRERVFRLTPKMRLIALFEPRSR